MCLGELLKPVTKLALYDIDIGEQVNVPPEIVERLRALVDEVRADLIQYDRIGSGVHFFKDGPRWPRRAAWYGQ